MNENNRICEACEAPNEETIAKIIRDNSNKISSTFSNICNVEQFAIGKSAERDVKDQEPRSIL